jgi:hypothetical protein
MLRRLLQLLYTLLVSIIDGLSDTREEYIDQKRDTKRDTPIGPASPCSISQKTVLGRPGPPEKETRNCHQ